MKPILKWVGGKRQLLKVIESYIPEEFNTYYEPFFGGGAVFFAIQPKQAKINDASKELINVYKQIKNHSKRLIEILKVHEKNHSKEYYYQIRKLDRNASYEKLNDLEKAARFIYLNKTCFNGLYRVNKSNQFNTPIGKYKNPLICDEENIIQVGKLFKNNKVVISNNDFEKFLKDAKKGDFVYLDPPYDPISDSSSFTAYQSNGFEREEQIRLKNVCDALNNKGIKFLLSNSDTAFINDLYKDYKIVKVLARRSVNSKADKRNEIYEVLIMNY